MEDNNMMNGNTMLPVSIPLGSNDGAFGGNGFDDIIALAIIAMIFGWNGNGNGIFGGGGMGANANYVLTSDFATIQRQLSDGFGGVEKGLDTIRNGLCDGFYTEAQMVNGVNTNIFQTGNEIQKMIQSDTIANMQNVNALQAQLADCCCENQKATMQAQYNLATESCATRQAIADAKAEILDYLTQDKIATLTAENQFLKSENRLCANNAYILGELKPKLPIPAYNVPNPFCGCGYGYNQFGTTIA